jgi:hypothetical protein
LGKGTKEKQASVDIVGFASSMPQKEAQIERIKRFVRPRKNFF